MLNVLLWNEEHHFFIDNVIMTVIIAVTAVLMMGTWM
jgi:hypothetical protein